MEANTTTNGKRPSTANNHLVKAKRCLDEPKALPPATSNPNADAE